MRRTWWGRAFAAVMAVWLALSLSEPAFLHACPVHGESHGAMDMSHGMSHGAMAGHDASHAPTHGASHQQCTCLGSCSASTSVGLRAAPVTLAEITTTATRDAGLPDYAYVPVAAEHVLPFQNGPPAALT